jgi:glycosyltransferase involved in cell wall biosynthesis
MASGTPVVAVGEMGTISVMRGDNGGFMVANDAGVFASRVLELLHDPQLRRRKAEEALRFAQGWSISAMAGKLEQVYRRVLDRRS